MHISLFVCSLIFIQFPLWAECARILLGVMPQGRSHAGSLIQMINRLKANGHTVDFYMEAYPDEKDYGLNKRFIHIKNHRNPFATDEYETQQWMYDFELKTQMYPFFYGSDSCDIVLRERREEFNELVRANYDLILTDSLFATCMYGIATMNKAKHVIMHSTNVETSAGTMRAFGSNWMLTPRSFMPLEDPAFRPEKLYYRVTGTYDWIGSVLQNVYVVGHRMNKALKPVIPDFSFANYISSASMVFTDMPPDIFVPFPRTNDLFEFGSYCSESKPLDEDWESFVSDPSSKGTILIAFGTVINWKAAPAWKFQAIVDTIKSLTDYRIVWSYNGDPIDLGPHVKMSKWLPQNDILHHNKTVLFFSHGGLKSVKEASCSSTPSIFMPMFAEQVRNAWQAHHHGFAEIVSKHTISTEILKGKILNIVNNSDYQNAASRVKRLYMDKIICPLDEGAHHFQRLLNFGGRMPEYFYPKAIQFSFFKYLSIDFLVVLPLVGIYFLSS